MSIEEAIGQLNGLLTAVEEEYTTDPAGFFARDRISSLGKFISIVSELCRSLGWTNTSPLKENPSFVDLGIRWANFLSKLDQQSVSSASSPSCLPSTSQLFDIQRNDWIDVERLYTNHERTLLVFLRHLA